VFSPRSNTKKIGFSWIQTHDIHDDFLTVVHKELNVWKKSFKFFTLKKLDATTSKRLECVSNP